VTRDKRRLSGSHVTAVMMRSVAIPRDPLYIWEARFRRGDERETGREREKEKETGWAHRWPLESGHAVTGRKRPLLALPRSSLQLCHPLATKWGGGRTYSLSRSRARFSFPELFSLRNCFLIRVVDQLMTY